MVRITRWLAGAVFGLSLATLIPFLAEKGAEPKGHAVLWILYGTLVVSALVWLVASVVAWLSSSRRPKPLEIVYSLDGSQELRVMLRRGRPQSVLLSVGFKNPNPYNLESVAINSLFPQGLRVTRCGSHGQPLDNEKGHWLTTPERLPDEPLPGVHKDYWADENVTIAGNGSKVLFFKMRLIEPGSYYFLTRLFGNVPAQEQTASLEVVETEDMFVGSVLNELIHDGEELANRPANAFSGNNAAYQRWITELVFATAVLGEDDRKWWEDASGEEVPGADDQWRSNIARRNVPALYDLRRRLDQPAREAEVPRR